MVCVVRMELEQRIRGPSAAAEEEEEGEPVRW